MLVFRQLFEKSSHTYTYLLGCGVTRKALLIDGVLETAQRDTQLIRELGLDLQYTLNTHVHADHVRSCEELRKEFPSLQTVLGDRTAKHDIRVKHKQVIQCGEQIRLKCLHTPGHTDGCYSFFLDNEFHPMVFTGDALLIRRCGRTDFQAGNAGDLYDSISMILYGLPPATLVYPGHDYDGFTVSSIEEEKKHNIRCNKTQTKQAFVDMMDNLDVRPPKNFEYFVTENQQRGWFLFVFCE